MMAVAYTIGREDYRKDVKAVDCPYEPDSKEAILWLQGWNDEMDEQFGVVKEVPC